MHLKASSTVERPHVASSHLWGNYICLVYLMRAGAISAAGFTSLN